ncbi:MAG: cytidine deaminase [Clostridia bacterium]|nr:cytidine deaminase [Clostridia bacterium]
MTELEITEFSGRVKMALEKAVVLSEKAVSEYYHYHVCAILIDEEGNFFEGVNWEPVNGATVCGEVGAVSSYLLSGRKKIEYIVTYGTPVNKEKRADTFCTPCGSCRQRLSEFCSKDTIVLGMNETGDKVRKFTLGELLPYSFNAENL